MKHLALAGPFILWLVLAVPLSCHHGPASLWAAAGHVHDGGSPGSSVTTPSAEGPEAGNSRPTFCQHQSSEGGVTAYGLPDSSLVPAHSYAGLEHRQGAP